MSMFKRNREQTMNDEEKTQIAFCWYQPEQWKLLKEVVPESLDDTYEEWKKDATESINSFRQEGLIIKKVSIDTKELLHGALKRGLNL